MRSDRWLSRRTLWVGSAMLTVLAGCQDITGVSDLSPVSGSWTYMGAQSFPEARALAGLVSWLGVRGGTGGFEGNFQIVEEGPGGVSRSLAGIGSGVLLADTVADFDLEVAGVRRRHIGVLRSDSIKGSWVELPSGTASGSFLLRKRQ